MPIYEYTCSKCNSKFDKLVKSMNGDEKIACPKCGSKKTERDLSVFAVGAEQAKSSRPAACEGCQGGPTCPMAGS